MPKGGRSFRIHLITAPPIDDSNKKSFFGNMDFHTGEIGQFDALGYNGYRTEEEDFYYTIVGVQTGLGFFG